MGSTVLTPAEVALHPRTQDSPPPPSCPRKPTSSTPSPTPPSSSSRRPLALWTPTRMVSFPPLEVRQRWLVLRIRDHDRSRIRLGHRGARSQLGWNPHAANVGVEFVTVENWLK